MQPRSASDKPRRGLRVVAAFQLGLTLPLLLEIVEIFKEQQPAGLLGVIQFLRQALVVAHGPVDIVESVLEH